MKKILILWFLAIGMANAQNIRIGVINGDTTTRPLPNLTALAWKNNNLYVVKPTGNTVKFLQNDSRIWVGDNNRVGIGTKTPSQPFEVAGNAKIGGSLQIGVGAGFLVSDANGLLTAGSITASDIPNLGAFYLPINGGGDINGTVSITNGDLRLLSSTDVFGEKTRLRLQNTGLGSTDSFFEIYRDNYFSWAGWVPGGSVFTLKNSYLGLGGQTNPQATLDLGTSGTFRWANAAGTNKFMRSTNDNGDAEWTTISKSTIGLSNVDNTSDANKPISTLAQTALDTKLNSATAASTYIPFSGGTFTAKTNNIATENTAYSASTAFQNGNNVGVVNQIYNNSNSTLSYAGIKLTTRSSLPTSWSILNVNSGLGLGDLVFGYGGSSASSEKMRLNNSGYLGIGKTPQRALDVEGDMSNSGNAYFAVNSGNVGIGTLSPLSKIHINSSNSVDIYSRYTGTSSVAGGFQIGVGGINQVTLLNRENTDMEFYTNNSLKAIIKANGNFGIGTYTPTAKLDVSSSIDGDGMVLYNSVQSPRLRLMSGNASGRNYAIATNWFNLGDFNILGSTAALGNPTESRISISQTGNVGIGTTAPTGKFDIADEKTRDFSSSYSTEYGNIHIKPASGTNDNSTGITFAGNSGGAISNFVHAGIFAQSSSSYGAKMHFATTDSYGVGAKTRMTINNDGNVGIGTLVPTSKLQVVGLPVYADNAAATTGGLTAGAFYRTSTGVLMVVY